MTSSPERSFPPPASASTSKPSRWPSVDNNCAALVRDLDWATTELGPIGNWSTELRSAVDLMLRQPTAIVILFGPHGALLYNDAYIPIAGRRHPSVFGQRVANAWPEIGDFNLSIIQRVLSGETVTLRDAALTIKRNGVDEDVTFDLDYSPLIDQHGVPMATFALVLETTERLRLTNALAAEREASAELNRRLAAETANLRSIFHNSPGFMCVLRGPEHVFEIANRSYLQLVGKTDLIGKRLVDVLPEVREQGFITLLDQVLETGVPYIGKSTPVTFSSGAGEPPEAHIVDFIFQPMRDGDRVTGIFVDGIDITERIAAEAEALANQEQFASFAEAAPLHVWAADGDGKLYWFNQRVYESTGTTPGSLDGDNWGSVVHPDDLPAATRTWAASIQNQVVYETEFRIWNEEHQAFRWHLVRAIPAPSPSGRMRWVGTNTDIEGKKADQDELARLNRALESSLAESDAARERIWSLSTEMMLIGRADGIMLGTNPAWLTLLGWHETELVGRPFVELVHPDDILASAAALEGLVLGTQTLRFENRYRAHDGSYRWFSWSVVPSGDMFHAVARDITAEKAAALALAEAAETLRQSQKMEAVGQLTGGIAHDFNNLLQGIVGSIEVVRRLIDQKRYGEIERFINSATSSAQRAAALTHRLLAFSRRQPLDPKPVRINKLVASMEDLLRRSIAESITMELALSSGLWITRCDANQVENAILNLVLNARDVMPDGGSLVIETSNAVLDRQYATWARDVQPGQYVCISVTDSGIGMSPEVMERAFDPFFTTKPLGQGTGLGLSMVYGFARQSDGYAKIYSEVGKGTSVKLYLPRYLGSEEQDLSQEAFAEPEIRQNAKVVLVVEDEEVVRFLVTDLLKDLGYRVLEAPDGPAGLKILQSEITIDMLVTDIGLPGLNGRQVADAGRLLRPDLKVLLMTGYAENAAVAKGFMAPGMQLITKPFALEQLARRIQDMLDGLLPT